MKTLGIIILLILTIALNAVSFYLLPRAYNVFKASLAYDYFGESKVNYFIDTTKFTFVYKKDRDAMTLEVTNSIGDTVSFDLSSIGEDTVKSTLLHDWTELAVNGNTINYAASKTYCKFIEITVNSLQGAKTINDNFVTNNETKYVLEPLKCLQNLPDNSLVTINDKFVSNE